MIDPSLSQPLLDSTDEYRPILSGDEMRGEFDDEVDTSEEDQHCDLLINAINGADDTTYAQRVSSRLRPSPRLTRSKAASSFVPPNHKLPSQF